MSEGKYVPERGWLTRVWDKIPKDGGGDPAFRDLPTVLEVFTPDQVTYMVNQQLYAQGYQREHHKKRAKAEAEKLAPIKKKIHELFHTSYINATPAQVEEAIQAVKEEQDRELE